MTRKTPYPAVAELAATLDQLRLDRKTRPYESKGKKIG
jgi:hypothetical protein